MSSPTAIGSAAYGHHLHPRQDVSGLVECVLRCRCLRRRGVGGAMAADGTRRPRSGPKPTLTRLSREWGSSAEQAMTGRMFQRLGLRMKLVLRLVKTGIDGSSRSVDVLEIVRRRDPGDIAAPGITLSQGKQLLGLIQQEVVAAQFRDHATR